MADILSQEEIDTLLDVLDNGAQHENTKDKVYLFFTYLKELGNITGNIEHPKIEFNFIEFRDLFTKANDVIEKQRYDDQLEFIKNTIKTELVDSVKALGNISLKIEDADFMKKSDDDLLYLTLYNKSLKMEIDAEKELLQKVTNACLGDLDKTEFTSISDLCDIGKEIFKPVLHKLEDFKYSLKNDKNLQYKFLMDNYQISVKIKLINNEEQPRGYKSS